MSVKMSFQDMKQKIKELKDENKSLKAEVAERALIMETLHDSEQHLHAMISCVPGAVYRFDINPRMILKYISEEISNITGYPASHFIFERVMPYRTIIHVEDIERVEKTITKRIEEKDIDPFLIEYRIIDAKDQIRWCSEKGQVLFTNNGKPLFLDGTIFDVTNQKSAEEKLRLANEKLEILVSTDWLTKIANRRHFIDRLEIEWKRLNREKGVLSMILCDIDYFKQFNDNYGHQEGDKCLYSVAQTIKSAVSRPGDLVSRFGGEEFIIILPHTDVQGAIFIAEKIRSKILELKIPHDYSTVAPYISLSLGVSACIPKPDALPETLIKAADEALYKAKKQGRNRVITNNY